MDSNTDRLLEVSHARRDERRFLLTEVKKPLDVAHICPVSLGDPDGEQHGDFWSTLKLFWSLEKVMAWERGLQEVGETLANRLSLSPVEAGRCLP